MSEHDDIMELAIKAARAAAAPAPIEAPAEVRAPIHLCIHCGKVKPLYFCSPCGCQPLPPTVREALKALWIAVRTWNV